MIKEFFSIFKPDRITGLMWAVALRMMERKGFMTDI